LQCLAKEVDQRFHTCLDLAEALRGWQPPGAAAAPSRAVPLAERKPAPISKWISIAATVAALLLVMVAIWQGGIFRGRAKGDSSGAASSLGSAPHLWQSLLDRPPEPRAWCHLTQDAQWNYDPDAKTLLVNTSELGMFSLGRVEGSSFRLEVRFAKSAWNGDTGIFWGLRPGRTDQGAPTWECEAIYLHTFLDDNKPVYRLNREWIQLFEPQGGECYLANRKQYVFEQAEPPATRDCSLEILVLENVVREVRFQGKPFPKLCDRLDTLTPPYPLVAQGPLGAINEGGAAVFREARLQVFPGPVSK
jgi:hypothetical protein